MANDPQVAPTERVIFVVGGKEITVPALTLYDLQETKPIFDRLVPEADWREYSADVLRIVATVLENAASENALTGASAGDIQVRFRSLAMRCSVVESKNKVIEMNEWLRVSGFGAGEEEAAIPGTGTLTGSSPNLPLEEFAEAIPS